MRGRSGEAIRQRVRAFLEVVNQIESSRANATRAGVERRATEAAADAATI